ncbi:hypothetical protein DINM_005532 [Dirofilaria immitis]|nr:hypothetical protein [Dirofilaria immitis]
MGINAYHRIRKHGPRINILARRWNNTRKVRFVGHNMDNREQKQENNEGQKENQNQENNEIKQEKNQKHNDQQDESDHRQNRPEALYDLRNDLNEEYKPFDNGYDSPLSSPVIREKIESVLHFNSLPLVEHGSLESQLYDSWHTNNDTSMNSSLSRDFFSVEHIQQRERELYNSCEPGNHLLQNLINLVESAVPSIIPRQMSAEGQNTVPDLLASADHQEGSQWPVTSRNDNFGNNFRSPSFSPLRFPNYLPAAFQHPISNHPAQFDSLTSNLSSSLFGTPPIIPTSHLSPEIYSQIHKALDHLHRFVHADIVWPRIHILKITIKGMSKISLYEARVAYTANYSLGTPRFVVLQHHFRITLPQLPGILGTADEHCPFKKKIVLKLKCDKRNDDGKGKKDDKDDKNDKYG